jgi:hypothetical protein
MTTALEAYLTGIVMATMSQQPLPDRMHPHVVTSDRGEVNGIIELHSPQGDVRMRITITENRGNP